MHPFFFSKNSCSPHAVFLLFVDYMYHAIPQIHSWPAHIFLDSCIPCMAGRGVHMTCRNFWMVLFTLLGGLGLQSPSWVAIVAISHAILIFPGDFEAMLRRHYLSDCHAATCVGRIFLFSIYSISNHLDRICFDHSIVIFVTLSPPSPCPSTSRTHALTTPARRAYSMDTATSNKIRPIRHGPPSGSMAAHRGLGHSLDLGYRLPSKHGG